MPDPKDDTSPLALATRYSDGAPPSDFPSMLTNNPHGWGNSPPIPQAIQDKEPWNFPGEARNLADRPSDPIETPLAESLSPTMGAYGMGDLLGESLNRFASGDLKGSFETAAPLLAMAMFPGPGKGRFLHGTTRDAVPSIRSNYLEPRVGSFVDSAYGGEYRNAGADIPELVYLAHENDPSRASNAIIAQVARQIGKSYHAVTPEDIKQHGAMIVARPDPNWTYRKGDDGEQSYRLSDDGPEYHYDEAATAEPGDFYSFHSVEPTGFLTGNRLLDYLDRRGLIPKPKSSGVQMSMKPKTPPYPGDAPQYPMAPKGEWYGDANYETTGGTLGQMTPDEFLSRARPLKMEETARENIDDLKRHMQEGRTLDPLALYPGGKEDGRHRAYAAKELGIQNVPVLQWPEKAPYPGDVPMQGSSEIGSGNRSEPADAKLPSQPSLPAGMGSASAAMQYDSAKRAQHLEGLRKYYSQRAWPDEATAKADIVRRIEKENVNDRSFFPPTDPSIVDDMSFVKRGNGVGVSQKGLKKPAGDPLELFDEPSEPNAAPDVDWSARDLQDNGTPESVMKNFGRGTGEVVRGYIPADRIPLPKGSGIKEGRPGGRDNYGWDELNFRGTPPPAKVRLNKNGTVTILDGNHRIAFWRDRGYNEIPVYAVDERAKGKK